MSAFACMHPSVCASFIIHAVFSLLSVFVFTCSSYLKWPRRRSNPQCALHLSLSEGQIVSPSVSRPAPTDTGKAGNETSVKRFTTACKNGAEMSPALSAYSGKSSGLVSRWVVMDTNVRSARSSACSSCSLKLLLTFF